MYGSGIDVYQNVCYAISLSLDKSVDVDTNRKAEALLYLESVKAGDVHVLVHTSFGLVSHPLDDIRTYALNWLQHIVKARWDELDPTERKSFTAGLLSIIADSSKLSLLMKEHTTVLILEIVGREGVDLLPEIRTLLVSLSTRGPMQAELMSMTLRGFHKDIIANEDLADDRRRSLLHSFTSLLQEILPSLYCLLDEHLRAASSEESKQQMHIAKHHEASVTSTLNAINAYAEWAPLPNLLNTGILNCFRSLLLVADLHLHVCEFFKLVSLRKRPLDAASEFDSAMRDFFQEVMKLSEDILCKPEPGTLMDERQFKCAELICESMVSLGSLNLVCLIGYPLILDRYLRQMLGYFQHYKLALHYHSLLFWLVNEKVLTFLSDESCSAMLEVSFRRLLKKEIVFLGTAHFTKPLELWSDDFKGKGEFSQYCSRLIKFIRFISCKKPNLAATRVSEKIKAIVNHIEHDSTSTQNFALMESMQFALDNVVSGVYDGLRGSGNGPKVVTIFEDPIDQLLSLQWTEATLMGLLAHYLVAFGPCMSIVTMGKVIEKLFELLLNIKDPLTSTFQHPRLQICTSFIQLAKKADKNINLFHGKAMADTISFYLNKGSLFREEYSLLGEALLIMNSAAGVEEQHKIIVWLLEPFINEWNENEWLEEDGFIRLFSEKEVMFSLFHTVTFFEKALKISGVRKGSASEPSTSSQNSVSDHPMALMLLPLLKLLQYIHWLWSPNATPTLSGDIQAAMVMSDVERTSLLGEGNLKLSNSALTFTDGPQFDTHKERFAEGNETCIQNWLKGIRDSVYVF